MDECIYKEILRKSRKILADHMDPELLVDLLRAQDVISKEDEERILRAPGETEQARMLAEVVSTKGPDGLKEFFNILRDENPYAFWRIQEKVLQHDPTADIPKGKECAMPVSPHIQLLFQCLLKRAMVTSTVSLVN
jgi:hypothetical protein